MDSKSNQSAFEELLSTVVRKDDYPIVLSKWGFRIEEIDGENYLIANSKEDLINYLEKNPHDLAKKPLEEAINSSELCFTTPGNFCKSNGCPNNYCLPKYMGGNYVICYCG